MVWDADRVNGGFGQAAHLAADPAESIYDHAVAVSRKRIRARSCTITAACWRSAHSHEALRHGSQTTLIAEGDVVRFRRLRGPNEELFCAFNLSDEPSELDLPQGRLGADRGGTEQCDDRTGRARASRAVAMLPGHQGQRLKPAGQGGEEMADLKLTEVEKAYGDVKVLSHINLDIATGELMRLRRAFGLRQVDAAADDRRARTDHRRRRWTSTACG